MDSHPESFRPHVIIQTERSIPSPIFVAALIGVDRILRRDFDLTKDASSYLEQALQSIPANTPAFGRPVGFVINYSPKLALRYDLNGNVTEVLSEAVTLGYAYTSMGLSFR